MIRDNSIHIADIITPLGTYWTVCGRCYFKQDRINTIATDDIFPGICKDCSSFCDDMYKLNLEEAAAFARNSSKAKDNTYLVHHRRNWKGPKGKFNGVLNRRWVKLDKYQALIDRRKLHD